MQQDIPMPLAWMCGLCWAELPEGATVPASCPACGGATGTHTPPAAGQVWRNGEFCTIREVRAVQTDGGVLWTWPGGTQPVGCTAQEWRAWAEFIGARPVNLDAPNAGISHPGGDAVPDAQRTGWRQGVAASWQALRGDVGKPAPCRGCLTILEALGNRGPDGGGV